MDSSKLIKVVLSIAIAIFLLCILLTIFKGNDEKSQGLVNTPVNNNKYDDMINNNIPEYIEIEEVSANYTVDVAINDGCYVIDKMNVTYNTDVLNSFESNVLNNVDSKIRVVMETVDSLLYIIDVENTDDKYLVTENNSQLDGGIYTNEYLKSDGYFFTNELVILGDGTQLQSYYLSKNESDEKVNLFAYVIENKENVDEYEIIEENEIIEIK